MSDKFAGYGDHKQIDVNEWRCPKDGVSMDWIEARAVNLVTNFIFIDTLYMSEDVYIQFMKSLRVKQRYTAAGQIPTTAPQMSLIVTSGGTLTVKMVSGFTDFCHIGTNATYNDLVRVQVDEAFEKIFLKDCERE